MSANPYSPPQADVTAVVPQLEGAVPEAVLAKIRQAGIAGIAGMVSTAITFATALYMAAEGLPSWQFIDVVISLGLTIGIFRKSRACASLMLAYFIASKVFLFAHSIRFVSVLVAVVFLFYYVRGTMASFEYHRLVKPR